MNEDFRTRQSDISSAAPTGDPAGGMVFAQVARLELDDLLEQLVSRAQDVQDTQGRLRGLLRAYLAVARADDLDVVLRHVVEAARELVNAGYAALGVVSGGRLVRFVHTGMDPDVVARVGHLPEGKGLLGLLVDYPQSLRLRDIAEHVASVGFPEHHPPMRSFLGVPIRVADRVFGNLYLTDKQGADEFTADDEELVQALAAAAARRSKTPPCWPKAAAGTPGRPRWSRSAPSCWPAPTPTRCCAGWSTTPGKPCAATARASRAHHRPPTVAHGRHRGHLRVVAGRCPPAGRYGHRRRDRRTETRRDRRPRHRPAHPGNGRARRTA